MNATDFLVRAKYHLEQRGWCQGTYEDRNDGSLCLEGALYEAAFEAEESDGSERSRTLFSRAKSLLIKAVDTRDYLTRWNDYTKRTEDEVLDALDKAVELARKTDEGGRVA